VTAELSKTLQECFHWRQTRNYLKHSKKWQNNPVDKVWWLLHEKALVKFKSGDLTTTQKYLHDRLPNNYKNNKYYPYKPKDCSLCKDNKPKDTIHKIRCTKFTEGTKIRSKFTTYMLSTLNNLRTNETTTPVLMHNIKACLQDKSPVTLEEIAHNALTSLIKAVEDQEEIGWSNFMKGRLTPMWGELGNSDKRFFNLYYTCGTHKTK
jgi:hypothetical protein